MILTAEQRANLREFFDHDKTNVFEAFMKRLQEEIRKKPAIGPSEWETIQLTLTREAQVDCVTEILRMLDDEMADQEVDNAE